MSDHLTYIDPYPIPTKEMCLQHSTALHYPDLSRIIGISPELLRFIAYHCDQRFPAHIIGGVIRKIINFDTIYTTPYQSDVDIAIHPKDFHPLTESLKSQPECTNWRLRTSRGNPRLKLFDFDTPTKSVQLHCFENYDNDNYPGAELPLTAPRLEETITVALRITSAFIQDPLNLGDIYRYFNRIPYLSHLEKRVRDDLDAHCLGLLITGVLTSDLAYDRFRIKRLLEYLIGLNPIEKESVIYKLAKFSCNPVTSDAMLANDPFSSISISLKTLLGSLLKDYEIHHGKLPIIGSIPPHRSDLLVPH